MGEGSCNLRPELWTLHPGCGIGPEWPPGVGGGADYTVRWSPESQPRSALNKGLSQGRAGGPREFVERPGPEHKGGMYAKTTGKDKGAFCSAVRTEFSAVAQPCRKDQEWELQPEWEAWTL